MKMLDRLIVDGQGDPDVWQDLRLACDVIFLNGIVTAADFVAMGKSKYMARSKFIEYMALDQEIPLLIYKEMVLVTLQFKTESIGVYIVDEDAGDKFNFRQFVIDNDEEIRAEVDKALLDLIY